MNEIKKVATLADAEEFQPIVEPAQKEMKLVDVSEFEGKESEKVTEADVDEIYALTQEMVKFTHARGGVGLAFPQIGIMKQAFIFLDGADEWKLVINPEFYPDKGKVSIYEKSLSYEGIYLVQRFKRISTAYYSIYVGKDGKLIMKKYFKQMSGMKSFLFQQLTNICTVGKTAKMCGIPVKIQENNSEEKEKENNES